MKEDELVSIIIPVYNSSRYLKDAIESIKKQTYQNYEVIFVDDKSTDNSLKIIEEYKNIDNRVKLIKLAKHEGAGIARNSGIKNAKGRYLTFLDSDDILVNNKLEIQVKFMKEKNCEFTCGNYKYINDGMTKISNEVKSLEITDYSSALLDMRILTSTVMIDLSIIPKQYCYMTNMMSEEVITWIKILKRGYMAYGINKVLVYYRVSKKSRSSNKIKTGISRWNIYRKIEKLSIKKSMYCFINYIVNAIKKRSVKWSKIDKYGRDDLQVLIAVQNMKDDKQIDELIKKSNVNSNYLVVNQAKESDIKNKNVITVDEKGLGKSRNRAIYNATREILLLADDDLKYDDNYADTIIKYHNKYEDAGIICFYVESKNKKRKTKRMPTGRVGLIKTMRIVSFEVSLKRKFIVENNLKFNEIFGPGAKFDRGDEQVFLCRALRKKIKIVFVNRKIGEAAQDGSTWFEGFNEKYFMIQGRVFKEMSPKYYKILIIQFIIRKYFLYCKNITIRKAIKAMFDGANL